MHPERRSTVTRDLSAMTEGRSDSCVQRPNIHPNSPVIFQFAVWQIELEFGSEAVGLVVRVFIWQPFVPLVTALFVVVCPRSVC